MDSKLYPAGGSRQKVYALMHNLGFQESRWSDKFWKSFDGIEVSIFGAGSMARISKDSAHLGECQLDDLSCELAKLRTK